MKIENEMKKRIYEPVSAVIVNFQTKDLLTVSGGNEPGINLPLDRL